MERIQAKINILSETQKKYYNKEMTTYLPTKEPDLSLLDKKGLSRKNYISLIM